MADLEARYYQVPLEDAVAQPALRNRWSKLSAALIGGSCLVLAFIVAISVAPVDVITSAVASDLSLFSLASLKSGPKLPEVRWTTPSVKSQERSSGQRSALWQPATAWTPATKGRGASSIARTAVVQESSRISKTDWGKDPALKLNLKGKTMQQCGYAPSDSSLHLALGYRIFRRISGYCDSLCVSVNQAIPEEEKSQRSTWWERDVGDKAPVGQWCVDPTDYAQAVLTDPDTSLGLTINCEASDGALRDYFEHGQYMLAYRRQEEAKAAMKKIREICDGETADEKPEFTQGGLYSGLMYIDPITGEERKEKPRRKEDWEFKRSLIGDDYADGPDAGA